MYLTTILPMFLTAASIHLNRIMALDTGGVQVSDILEKAQNAGTDTATANLENAVNRFGGAGYRLIYMAAIFLFAIGLIYAFIKLFFSNGQTRSETKGDIIWKVIAVICAVGVLGMITLLTGVGSQLFGNVK